MLHEKLELKRHLPVNMINFLNLENIIVCVVERIYLCKF